MRVITFISDHWYDMTGAPPGAIGDWMDSIYSDDREVISAAILPSVERRERFAVETRIIRADGAPAWAMILGAPRFNDEGQYDGYVGALIDVSERRAAVDALQHTEARLSLALEGTKVGVWDWDINSGAVWMSDGALEIQGFARDEVTPHAAAFEPYIHPDDWPVYRQQLRDCLKGVTPLIHAENRLRCKQGGWVWVSERARVVERDANGRALRMIGTRTDMTEQRARDERIRWLAAHDVLTELPNRAQFQELLLVAMREADARGRKMALLLLDIDRFKQVNDTLGHGAGDTLLRRIAARLRKAFPAPASIARLGGDEFAVILSDVRNKSELKAYADRAVLADGTGPDGKLDSSASVGAAFYPDHAQSAADLMKCADAALYRAKDEGRARSLLYDPNDETSRLKGA